jgi:phosphoenolpyruvate carboxykinase (GTP)
MGQGKAEKSAIGYIPAKDGLDLNGINIPDADLTELLKVDKEEWKKEIPGIREHFAKFGDKTPKELNEELESLIKRLG